MSSADINAINQALANIQSSFNEITGNTLSNYNQLTRIINQQSNIYNTIYYGTGNLTTGNLTVNNNYTINGTLTSSNLNLIGNLGIYTSSPTANLYVTGNAFITSNLFIGSAPGNPQSGTLLSVTNTTNADSNVSGSLSGSVYHQASFGSRNWTFSQDTTNSQYMYFGCQLGGDPDPDYEYFFKKSIGLQIQPLPSVITTDFNSALSVLGNAVITGNLNVDNGTFWIDATNNRAGINNTNPLQALDVVGSANLTGSLFVSNQLNAAYGTNAETELAINYAGYLGGATQYRNTTFFDGKNNAIAKLLGSTGNLGIGTLTPVQKLDVRGNVYINGLNIYPGYKQTTATSGYVTYDINASGTHYFWDNIEASGAIISGGGFQLGSTISNLTSPFTIVTGTYTVGSIGGNSVVGPFTIVFGVTFSSAPVVTATARSGTYGESTCIMITPGTTTGTMYCKNTNNSTGSSGVVVQWIAIGLL